MQVRFDLLRKLANHGISGKLTIQEFNFKHYNPVGESKPTSGCLITECPTLFSKWKFKYNGAPILEGYYGTAESVKAFFGLTTIQYDHLFVPTYQKPGLYGGIDLDEDSTKEEVANNILQFCDRIEAAAKANKTGKPILFGPPTYQDRPI